MLLRNRRRDNTMTFGSPLPDVAISDPRLPVAEAARAGVTGLAQLIAGHRAGLAARPVAPAPAPEAAPALDIGVVPPSPSPQSAIETLPSAQALDLGAIPPELQARLRANPRAMRGLYAPSL